MPQSKFVKDLVRCTVLVRTFDQLRACWLALLSSFKPAGVKNRLDGITRDVLCVIPFPSAHGDILCEIQFHFSSIVATKAFSHAAYNIVRALDPIELFDFPKSNMATVTYKDILSKIKITDNESLQICDGPSYI